MTQQEAERIVRVMQPLAQEDQIRAQALILRRELDEARTLAQRWAEYDDE
jgi:hypothetical protein